MTDEERKARRRVQTAAASRRYRLRNLDSRREALKVWKAANPEKVAEIEKRYAERNRERINANARKRYHANKAAFQSAQRKWLDANRAEINARAAAAKRKARRDKIAALVVEKPVTTPVAPKTAIEMPRNELAAPQSAYQRRLMGKVF